MKTYVAVVLLVLQVSWSLAEDQVAPDGTVAAQPLLTVPAPAKGVNASPQAAPGSHLNEIPNVNGVTSETKNPDGSTTRITHFRGQLPPNAYPQFPQFNPYLAYSMLPPYFYPFGGPPHPGPGYAPPLSPQYLPQSQPGNLQPQPQSAAPANTVPVPAQP